MPVYKLLHDVLRNVIRTCYWVQLDYVASASK